MRIRIFICCGSGSDFHPDPDPDPSFQIKAQTIKKCSNRLISHTFWLFICKLMRIRIFIWCKSGCGSRIQILICILCGCGSGFPKWCGSMRIRIHNTAAYQWVECRGIFWRAQWRSSRRASGSGPGACTHPPLWREPAQKPISQLSLKNFVHMRINQLSIRIFVHLRVNQLYLKNFVHLRINQLGIS